MLYIWIIKVYRKEISSITIEAVWYSTKKYID